MSNIASDHHHSRFRWVLVFASILMASAPLVVSSQSSSVRAEVTEDSVLEPLFDPAAFREPPMEFRPKMRWWWGSPLEPEEVREELSAMADAGFGGAEIAFFGNAWANEAQRGALAAALEVAKERDVSLDVTLGKAWPVTTPDTGGDRESLNHAQEMMYGTLSVVGPGDYRVPPPPPMDANVYAGAPVFQPSVGQAKAKLVAVTAALVAEEGTPVVATAPDVPYQPVAPTAPAKSTVLDSASVVDLTSTIDADGMVRFQPPRPGRWLIFALWQRPAIQNVMDHLRADATDAVTAYLDKHQIGTGNADALAPGSYFFEDSLELTFNGVPWTEGFFEEFAKRRGYELAPFASTIFVQDAYNVPGHDPRNMPNADFEFAGDVGERVRQDFLRTLTELYRDNHLERFQEWARSHGMRFRAQPYGSVFDAVASSRALATGGGGADVESLGAGDPAAPGTDQARSAMDHYRLMASGSQQGGGGEVSSELGATFFRGYMASLSEYKALMDKEWAAGVTTPIIHGFAYQEPGAAWPGTDYMSGAVAQNWNHRHFPEWSMWRRLTDYWTRGSFVLRSGRPVQDLAVYRDAPTAVTHPSLFDGVALERTGYTYGYVDRDGLEDERAAGDGVLYPKGPSYRAVVVDEDSMAGDAAQALAGHSARGLAVVIVGDPPRHGTSNSDTTREDQQVAAAFQKILSSSRTRVVDTQSDVLDALGSLGIEPGVRYSRSVALMSQRRQTADADYWYLWNNSTDTVAVRGSFATTGIPKTLDLWSGTIEPVAEYTRAAGRVDIPVVLRAGETRVIAFDRTASPESIHVTDTDAERVSLRGSTVELRDSTGGGTRFVALSNGERRQVELPELPAPISLPSWDLHVVKSQPSSDNNTVDLHLDTLDDWRNIPALQDASGTGTYTTTLDLPANWMAPDRGMQLDLGTTWGSVQVFVNGHLATPTATTDQQYDAAWLTTPPTMRHIDVTSLLRAGTNQIRVVLATTLKNAATAEAKKGNTNVAAAAATGTQPYGLKGPVVLRPFGRAFLNTDAATRPDLTVTDLSATQDKPKQTRLSVTVGNAGESDATGVVVEFRDGETVLGRAAPVSVPAGGSVPVSYTWDTRGTNGDHLVTAVVDPADTVVESNESNNQISRNIAIRGNKVTNGSFEANSDGKSPDGWSGSGSTSYDTSGGHATEGSNSVGVTGTGSTAGIASWTSSPIEVDPGRSYDLAMTISTVNASSEPSLRVSYLDATGAVVSTVSGITTALSGDSTARQVTGRITVPAWVSKVRLTLSGFTVTDLTPTGTVWFDEIWMW
jgi:hypothetical protein